MATKTQHSGFVTANGPRWTRWLPLVVLALGLGCSWLVYARLSDQEQQTDHARFLEAAREHVWAIREEVENTLDAVNSTVALYRSSEYVTQSEFAAFTGHVLVRHRPIRAIAWAPRIAAGEVAAFEASARGEGLEGYEIVEQTAEGRVVRAEAREEYYPIRYIEPGAGNEGALGFDVGSDPVRLRALREASSTGLAAASGSIRLIQDSEGSPGFLLVMPVTQQAPPADPSGTPAHPIEGFVLGQVRVVDLIQRTVGRVRSAGIVLYVFDSTPGEAANVLYPASLVGGDVVRAIPESGLQATEEVAVCGRRWLVRCEATGAFAGAWVPRLSTAFLIVGIVFSTLVGAYLDILQRRFRRQGVLLETERRFGTLLNNLPGLAYRRAMGAGGGMAFVSQGSVELTGYRPEELIRGRVRTYDELIVPSDRERVSEQLSQAVKEERSFAVTYRIVRSDGSVRWVWEQGCSVATGADRSAALEGIVTDITPLRETQARERRYEHHIGALHSIDRAIIGSVDLRLTMSTILELVAGQLDAEGAHILLLDRHTRQLVLAVRHGAALEMEPSDVETFVQKPAEQAVAQRRLVSIQVPSNGAGEEPGAGSGGSCIAQPLVSRGKVLGAIHIMMRRLFEPDLTWLGFLDILATQTAIAIDHALLVDDLRSSRDELSIAYDETLEGWAKALELRDLETRGHSDRVTLGAVRLAQAMGVTGEALEHLRRGALLHDVGKIGIPDRILLKPGPLTIEERAEMEKHPVYAYELLKPIRYLRPALEVPYCHHEKWDGSGYPRRLRGDQIPLSARIFAVVDVWDALRSNRPYREPWPEDRVRDHIRQLAGSHFDPDVVEAFFRLPT